MFRIYTYQKCSTCRKALQFLEKSGLKPEIKPIREQPPTRAELKRMLSLVGGDVRKLFNTSGQDYQAMKLKEHLPKMTTDAALELLSTNGNLVKRPFLLTPETGLVGFKEEEWKRLLGR